MVRNRINDVPATSTNRDHKTPLIILQIIGIGIVSVAVTAAVMSIAAPTRHTTRTVYRVPASCTRAALAAAQNEIDWQTTFQAHVNVEQEALDGETYRLYRQHLAEAPGPPKPVDLGSCR